MSYLKPEKDAVSSILSLIMGDEVEVCDGTAPAAPQFHGVFIDASQAIVARVSCELSTAAALGCALSMIPPGGADAMVEDKELSSGASANLYEVMNMLSSVFMNDRSSHLKLARVDTGAAPELATTSGVSIAYGIDLGRYGKGVLDFSA